MSGKMSFCNIATGIVSMLLACTISVKADWAPDFKPGILKVGPSALVPKWSAVNAGEWTFNYEGALAKAKAEGKYTLLLFAGMWWCPHCQSLEENVLVKDEFKQYVAEHGYYLAALDFPFRDGHSMWTWLWDPAYRAANGIGDWTPQQIADEYVKRFEYQELMHTEGTAITTNNNVLVEISADGTTTNLAVYAANPTTVYRRVVYPTIIVIDPDGNEVGRFDYDKKIDPAVGLGYVIDEIEALRTGGSSDLFVKPGVGGVEGAVAQTYDAVLTDMGGVPVGVATFKTARRSARTGESKVTGRVQISGDRTVALAGVTYGAEGEKILLSKNGAKAMASITIGADGVIGSYTDGETTYMVQGARNPFLAKDSVAVARAATLKKGYWTFALANAGGSGSGFSTFSVATAAKGKVKVTGFLGDGSRVALSAQALFGENGKVLVPVIAKKRAFSMLLEFDNWKLSAVKGISGWKSMKSEGMWPSDAIFAADSGAGAVPEIMYLQIGGGFNSAAGVGGKQIAVSPVDDAVLLNGRRWTGTKGITDLNMMFYPKDGTFNGSFYIYVTDGGKTKKLRANVSGVVIDGVPYGTAVIRRIGVWPVKLAGVCGGGC